MELKVRLTRAQIVASLPKVAKGLGKYLCLQTALRGGADIVNDTTLQKAFNGFYRVRRNEMWRRIYFQLMVSEMRAEKKKRMSFSEVLDYLLDQTKRVEASFASKLIATLDPLQPVIDSVVLDNVGGRLPYPYKTNRLQEIASLHKSLLACFREYLATADGKFLVSSFKQSYPKSRITDIKMLDLVLWQTRKPRHSHKKTKNIIRK